MILVTKNGEQNPVLATQYFPQSDYEEVEKQDKDYKDGFICVRNRFNGEEHYFPCSFYTVSRTLLDY